MDIYIYVYNLLFKSCDFAPQRLGKIEMSAVYPPINLYYLLLHCWFIPKSTINRLCLSTSKTVLAPLVALFFPNFQYSFDIMWLILYFGFFASITLLDDLFFCSLLYTLVSGLLYHFPYQILLSCSYFP